MTRSKMVKNRNRNYLIEVDSKIPRRSFFKLIGSPKKPEDADFYLETWGSPYLKQSKATETPTKIWKELFTFSNNPLFTTILQHPRETDKGIQVFFVLKKRGLPAEQGKNIIGVMGLGKCGPELQIRSLYSQKRSIPMVINMEQENPNINNKIYLDVAEILFSTAKTYAKLSGYPSISAIGYDDNILLLRKQKMRFIAFGKYSEFVDMTDLFMTKWKYKKTFSLEDIHLIYYKASEVDLDQKLTFKGRKLKIPGVELRWITK